jgi:hypothetical protein
LALFYRASRADQCPVSGVYVSSSKHGPVRFVIALRGNNGAMRFELLKAIESEL